MSDASRPGLAPSIFAADFCDIGGALALFEACGVDEIHFDVMDNRFVPNISFGQKMIADVKKRCAIPADVHLMIDLSDDSKYAPFLKLPVESVTVHYEAAGAQMGSILKSISQSGKKAGISIKPGTPVDVLVPWLSSISRVLVMSVEPGFSGQSFMENSIGRLKELSRLIGNLPVRIQIDGGIGRSNYLRVLEAGADDLVIGSAFFSDSDPSGWVEEIHARPGRV